jgi:hypothetical protein
MRINRIASIVTLTALSVTLLPGPVLAADDRKPAGTSTPAPVAEPAAPPPMISAALVLSKSSIARAVAPLKAPDRATLRNTSREAAPRMRQGGGKTALVMSIVMMAVGAGTTYYLVKEMNKYSEQANDENR